MTFSPNFITKLVTTALILPMGLGGIPVAEAADMCQDIAGGRACVTSFREFDVIEANIPILGGSETLQITCDGGWEYKSKGDWAKSTADTFVESYCEGRGWNAHS
jgi:hypothetical protein